VLRALALRPDGGVFFEPNLVWQVPQGVETIAYERLASQSLRKRKDIIVLKRKVTSDAGVRNILVSTGTQTANIDLDFEVQAEPFVDDMSDAGMNPPIMNTTGCGCSQSAGFEGGLLLLLGALGLARRKVLPFET
jgi:hypothetical protein